MKRLTVQVLIDSVWHDAATLTLLKPELGSSSPTKLGYELDYAVQWMDRSDEHACSVSLPVRLMDEHNFTHWFGFLDDIVPSGAARRYWVDQFGLRGNARTEQDIYLLEKGAIAPVGNLRIKEALPSRVPGSTLHLRRFPALDVVERHTDFLEYAHQMGAVSGGATGAGGEAPKLLVRCSPDNEVWIDTFQDTFSEPDEHYLVKFPRGARTNDDCDILRAEFYFYHELTSMGISTVSTEKMRLMEGVRYPSLWLPRFDVYWDGSSWRRLGLESIYSVLNQPPGSYFKHFEVIERVSSLLSDEFTHFNVAEFVCEWVKRDLLNIAFGNSDNHGRNTALLKKNGAVELSPIYDFAPMKADPEGVPRTITWGAPYEEAGEFRWEAIAEQLDSLCPASVILTTLKDTAAQLVGLKMRLEQRGVPERILNMPVMGFDYLDQKLARWGLL